MGEFVHLHLHTEFSLLDGFTRINKVFKKAKELGMDAVAITDHGSMFGVVDFYKAAKANDIKPIIGCEVYVAPRKMTDKDSSIDKPRAHLVLLCKDEIGYKNLIKLVSMSYTDGFYYKPRIDYDILEQYSEGLIGLSACLGGDVQKLLASEQYDKATEMALRLNGIFGQGDFYLELQDHGIDVQKQVNLQLIKMSKETGIPLVASNDVHYLEKDDVVPHDVLLCIQTAKNLSDTDRMRFPSDEFYFKSPDEMKSLFPYAKEAIENTVKIAEKCNFDFDFETMHLPEYDVPDHKVASEYLKEVCLKGLYDRYDVTDEHLERLEFELNTITDMGFDDYFLITWDFIKYAKDNGILVGPGRGSCGGSIVAYVLRITDVDPLKYDLIFERFLNPERVTMPDIDIDFQDDRRGEVIDYVIEKYGKDKVAQIITFGTLAARAAIRDVGRVMDITYQEVDKIAKEIPAMLGITIDKAIDINEKLKTIYDENGNGTELLDVAKKLEGVPRHVSTHAAGVVIAKQPIDTYVPLYVQDDNVSTQFNMVLLEELGLLKMDFLGLRTLTVIQNAVKNVKRIHGVDLDFETISVDDPLSYEIIAAGNTQGIFQLESPGMTKFMKDLKPSSIEDIIAGISLYRPGPMDSIPKYLENKHNPEGIEYLDPKLKDILGVTYGCLVYQEQVMRIVRELGGYSYGRSDLVRRAMSKKKMKVMEEEREYFINGKMAEDGTIEIAGCVRNGVPKEAANEIFDDMIDFAKYAFNKSHAAGYALITFQTAYLKAHYNVEYMAALMTSVMGNQSKLAQYIHDARKQDIDVLPPDVNKSYKDFSVEGKFIRYGLLGIKSVGAGIIESLIEKRKDGQFKSFSDFCERITGKELNKKAIESLIKAGAYDCTNAKRSQLLGVYETVIAGIQRDRKKNIEGQMSLFSMNTEAAESFKELDKLPNIAEFDKKYILMFEKEVLGIYYSGHPLGEFEDKLDKISTLNLGILYESIEADTGIYQDEQEVILAGIISRRSDKMTKKGDMMSFITVDDLYAQIDVVVFPRLFAQISQIIDEDSFVIIKGRINIRLDDEVNIIANSIEVLDHDTADRYVTGKAKKLFLKIETLENEDFSQVKEILSQYNGGTEVVLYIADTKKKLKANRKLWVKINEGLLTQLRGLLGDDCVKYI